MRIYFMSAAAGNSRVRGGEEYFSRRSQRVRRKQEKNAKNAKNAEVYAKNTKGSAYSAAFA
jgi:hypothetical protein